MNNNNAMLESAVLEIAKKTEEILDEKIRKMQEIENMGDNELEELRERRKEGMRRQAERRERMRLLGHGEYRVCTDEKDFFAQAKTSDRLVVHFGRNATPRCEILDGHLKKLCRTHFETKFLFCNAEKSPFLADRLNIRVLPSLVLVKGGKVVEVLVGFEQFGNRDDFSTSAMERVLHSKHGIIDEPPVTASSSSSSSSGRGQRSERELEETEEDDDY